MNMDMDVLRAELKRDEGLRLVKYRCTAGKLTIGYGRNLDDVGILPEETRTLGITKDSVIRTGITQAIADALLEGDIARAMADLDRALPWWRKLDGVRQRVMVNMVFNMGIGRRRTETRRGSGLLGFNNTLAAIERGDWARAVAGMQASDWYKQVKARAVRMCALMKGGASVGAAAP